MLPKRLIKIDKYFLLLSLVLAVLSVLIIYTLQGIFTSLNTSSEPDDELVGSFPLVDDNIDKIYQKEISRKIESLDL